MTIKELLEKEHSSKQTQKIVSLIGNDKKKFAELMALVLGTDKLIAQRGSWVMSCVAEEHPTLISKYLKRIIPLLTVNGFDGIKRNVLRVLQSTPIPEEYEATLIDLCYKIVSSQLEPRANRAYAISTLLNVSKKYPELLSELSAFLIELMKKEEIPAVLSRSRLALKEIKKISI